MNNDTTVGILGAGISGLTAAFALQKEGISTVVYEKSDEVGGAIQTVEKDGWLVEEGPNTLMVKSQEVWQLLDDLVLDSQMVQANEVAKKRFVVKNRKPVAIPMSLGKFLSTSLITAKAKFRLFKEPFIPATEQEDESVASFIERRLGRQPLDYGINPFVSGIYAGNPRELSVKHTFSMLWELEQQYGSIVKGMFKKDRPKDRPKRAMISFREGNQTLPYALAHSLKRSIKTSTAVTSVKKRKNKWLVSGSSSGQSFENKHDYLISTIPSYALPDLFESQSFIDLAKLPYAPISVLGLGFEANQVGHPLDGFGMLIPEVENFKTLGVLFSSNLFPNRAPDNHVLLTCFIGGARNPEIASQPKEKLISLVSSDLKDLLDINASPVFSHHKYWEKAIPQYPVGYDRYLSLMGKIEEQNPGLFLQGNFRGGVSVPDCITSAFETAQKILAFLDTR